MSALSFVAESINLFENKSVIDLQLLTSKTWKVSAPIYISLRQAFKLFPNCQTIPQDSRARGSVAALANFFRLNAVILSLRKVAYVGF